MKTYLKIFLITTGVQWIGFLSMYGLDEILKYDKSSTTAPFLIGLFFLLLSLALGIILPIKHFDTKKKKIMAIFFLPSNYTWLILVLAGIKLINDLLYILENIPTNFG